jgi:hypothetical protein
MRGLACLVGERRSEPALKGGAVEENKEPTTSNDEVEAHGPLERSPSEQPAEDLQRDDEPDFEGHALLERSPTESPTESPVERAPFERPVD